jgi:hypothetical protein
LLPLETVTGRTKNGELLIGGQHRRRAIESGVSAYT